jgi:hypothetical protein
MAVTVTAPLAGLNPHEWSTEPEAAAAGVLERTVRRWIKPGQVATQLDLVGRRRVQRSSLPESASASDIRALVAEEKRALVVAEWDRQAEGIVLLRQQFQAREEARREEAERQATAETELCRLLLVSH